MRFLFALVSLVWVVDVGAQDAEKQKPKRRVLKAKFIDSSDAKVAKALDIFQKSANARDQIIYAKMDYLYRLIPIHGENLGEPRYEVGRLIEDYVTSDFLIDSMVLVPRTNDNFHRRKPTGTSKQGERPVELSEKQEQASIAKSKKAWEEAFEKLQDFVSVQRSRTDFEPTELELAPITPFFNKSMYQPKSGGAFISTSEMCFKWKAGSSIGHIDPPGASIPHWVHYFDPRALGFANRQEVANGASLGAILRRINTGDPFGVEKVNDKDFVTVVFSKALSRFLFSSDQGFLPVYSVDYRGEPRGEHRALLVEKPKIQSWIKPVKINGVWVPSAIRILDNVALIDIEMKWHVVNRPFEDSPFTLNSIPLRPGTQIVDRRSIPPTVEVLTRENR